MIGQIIFTLAVLVSFGLFAKNVGRLRRNILLGKPEKITGNTGQRLKNMTLVAFGQQKMFKRIIPALLHLCIYVAFVITQIELIEVFIDGFTGQHRLIWNSISDTGIGISDNDKKLVFEAFTQVDGSTIREYQGTGLGLAITKRLIKMHNGHIWVDSQIGHGSTFNVLLPSVEMIKTPKHQLDPDDERPVVLLADEDELALQLMAEYLTPENYNVIIVRRISELLSTIDTIVPAVIISDLIMPDADGLDIISTLQANDTLADIPIIICSILDREQQLLELGIKAFIKKPISRKELLTILDTLDI